MDRWRTNNLVFVFDQLRYKDKFRDSFLWFFFVEFFGQVIVYWRSLIARISGFCSLSNSLDFFIVWANESSDRRRWVMGQNGIEYCGEWCIEPFFILSFFDQLLNNRFYFSCSIRINTIMINLSKNKSLIDKILNYTIALNVLKSV